MAGVAVLQPLFEAGLTASVRTDNRLVVTPSERITPALDAHIRTNRDELIAAIRDPNKAGPPPLDWPPPEPAWFTAWMEPDDRRRAELMAAGKARIAGRHSR
jgi:hypothetical protein